MPPINITLRCGRSWASSVSKMRIELVITTRSATSTRCVARCHVVVPAVSPIAVPGRTRAAAAAAMASFSAVCSDDLARKPGSSVVAGRSPVSVAPPCTLVSSPCWVRASRSRRIVMSLTPSSVVSSLTRTEPCCWTWAAISSRRRRARTRRPAGEDCSASASAIASNYRLGSDRKSTKSITRSCAMAVIRGRFWWFFLTCTPRARESDGREPAAMEQRSHHLGEINATFHDPSLAGAFAVPEQLGQPLQPPPAARRRRLRPRRRGRPRRARFGGRLGAHQHRHRAPAAGGGGAGDVRQQLLRRGPTARRSPRRSRRPAFRRRSTPSTTTPIQENFNTYIQQPDDVMSLVRRLPHAGVRQARCRRRHLATCGRRSPASARGSRRPRTGRDGKQYFVPFYYYPWAVHYRKSVFEEAGYEIPVDVGRVQGAARPDAGRRDHSVGRRQRRQLAADGHVRHAQPADQRLRLPRLADGRTGELDRRPGQGGVHRLGGAAPLLPARRQRPHVAGRRDRAGQRRDRRCMLLGTFIASATSIRRPSRTSSTTSTSSPSRRSTTSTARTPSRRRSTGS